MVQVFFGAQNVKSLGCVFFLAQGSRGLVLHGICPAGDGPKKVTRPCECAMWGPRSIAKLVQITPITTVYGKYNYSIHGANLNQLIIGGAHCSDAIKYWAQADLQVCDGSIPEIPC